MSALAHFADSTRTSPEVREVPEAEILSEARSRENYAKGGRAPVAWHIMISRRSKVMACRKSFALLAK
jgi:hypothetical protein